MTTVSRPVVYDKDVHTPTDTYTNLTGDMWADVMRTLSTGRASGMAVSVADNNTATVAVGWGLWGGFKLDVNPAEVLSVPPIAAGGAAKTYSLGVLFDPAKLRDQAGPLSLKVFDKTAIDTSGGKRFWTLREYDRKAGVALTATAVRTFDVISAGVSFEYDTAAPLPPAREYPYGHILLRDDGWYRRGGGSGSETWFQITGDTGWTNVSAAPGAVPLGAGFDQMASRLTNHRTKRAFRGAVQRSDGGLWVTGAPVRLGSVGSDAAPAVARQWSNGPLGHFELRTNGDIYLIPREDIRSTRIDGEVNL